MIRFKEFLAERIGIAGLRATNMGLTYYGFGRWGKNNSVMFQQQGVDQLIPVKKSAPVELIKRKSSDEVNQDIKQNWAGKKLGHGMQSAVYSHEADPNTVIKVTGAGIKGTLTKSDIMFIHFLLDHGKENDHFPNLLDVNVDHPHVMQIKMEKMTPCPDDLGYMLENLADSIDSNDTRNTKTNKRILQKYLKENNMLSNNSVADICIACRMLSDGAKKYGKEYGTDVVLDLHGGNWMIGPNGRVIAADPWISWEEDK